MHVKISKEITKRREAEYVTSKLVEHEKKRNKKINSKKVKKKQKMAVQIESQNWNSRKKKCTSVITLEYKCTKYSNSKTRTIRLDEQTKCIFMLFTNDISKKHKYTKRLKNMNGKRNTS